MDIGIFAKTFAAGGLAATLDAVAASGLRAIQFNLALAGGATLPETLRPDDAASIGDGLRRRSLDVVAVSGTGNLAHPDPAARHRCVAALGVLIAAAAALGTGVVTLCTGSRDPEDMWRWHPDNASDAAWRDMVTATTAVVEVAEQHGVVVAFEPEPANVVSDAVRGRRLLEEIASPHLKVVFDAANLIAPDRIAQQAEILDRSFELLGEDLVLAHAKDVRADGAIVPAGRGDLDYGRYVSLLRQYDYEGALVLHGLDAVDVSDSVAFLRRHLDELEARTPRCPS